MGELPNVCLSLSNRPENVLLVREILTGMAEAIDLDCNDLNDIRTAVTEACNNVVLHAYEGNSGLLEVEIYGHATSVEVVVRDHGGGIKPRIRTIEETALGIGLSVIQALAHRVEFKEPAGSGTEVRMEFSTPLTRAIESPPEDGELPPIERAELATTTGLTIAPASLARAILPRVLSVLAARAHFSTDRVSDAQLVADALAAQASVSLDGHPLSIAANVEPSSLELRVGPVRQGRALRLITESAVEGLGQMIEKLIDGHRVASCGSGEVLVLLLTDRS